MSAGVTLREVEAEVRRLAGLVGAPDRLLPTFGASEGHARPHVEADARGLHWVVVERGREIERDTFGGLDGLLERVFDGVTFEMAGRAASRDRAPMADPRRLLFAEQEALMHRLSPAWGRRLEARHAAILADHPFDDAAGLRSRLARRLRGTGLDADAAWARACELVPLP